MKHRQWKTKRQFLERPDAQHRWDQAYQSLLHWTQVPTTVSVIKFAQTQQEESDENSRICPSLHSATDTNADD